MWMLCSVNGVQHNCKVTTGRVFHAGSNIKTADRKTVVLILYGAGTDGNIGE